VHISIIGGGWTAEARDHVYGPFLRRAGDDPTIACVVLDEGDGAALFARWEAALTATAACRAEPVLVELGSVLDVTRLGAADGLLVCGGLTPAYADSLAPVAGAVRSWLSSGDRPYCGFSAGAAVASGRALVGGYRLDGVMACPEDAGEDLEEISVVDGLGLVPVSVDVHAAQWGTLGRAVAAVDEGRAAAVWSVDEDTVIVVDDGAATVAGLGRVHEVRSVDGSVEVRAHIAGDHLEVG
jgi:cyanophycinase